MKIASDSITTLGRFSRITENSNFEIFLIQSDSNYIFLIGDKVNQKIINFFFPERQNRELIIKQELRSDKPQIPLFIFLEIEEKVQEGYNSPTEHVYEKTYFIDEKGSVQFKEKTFNYVRTFFQAPENHQFSGAYKQKSDQTNVLLIVKDASSKNHFSYRISILNSKTSQTETFIKDNQKLDDENSLKWVYNDKLIFEIYFENERAKLLWHECSEPSDISCSTIILTKEKE